MMKRYLMRMVIDFLMGGDWVGLVDVSGCC